MAPIWPRSARHDRRQAMKIHPRFLSPLAVALVLGLGCRAPAHTAPARPVVFFDDFSGDSLDRTKWTVRVTGRTVNEEQQAYVDDTATIRVVRGARAGGASNGALLIRGRARPGHFTP